MTWTTFSLGGVSPHKRALWGLNVAFGEEVDTPTWRRTSTGDTKSRLHWRKRTITLSGTGKAPLYLPGVDYTGSLTLALRDVSGVDASGFPVWSDQNFTVVAKPPVVSQDRIGGNFSWTLECEEVNATVLHALPFTLSLGGQTPHDLAMLDLTWDKAPITGGGLLRFSDGSAEPQVGFTGKQRIQVSGSGWVPLNVWSGLDFTTTHTLQLSKLNTITSDNPTYTTESLTVWTPGISETWNPVSRLYDWQFDAKEV